MPCLSGFLFLCTEAGLADLDKVTGPVRLACTMSVLLIPILQKCMLLNVDVMPSMPPFAPEKKRAVPRGSMMFR